MNKQIIRLKHKKRNKIIEKWIEYRFLNSEWTWRDDEQKQSTKTRIFEKIEDTIAPSQKRKAQWLKPVLIAASILIVGSLWMVLDNRAGYTTIRPDQRVSKVVTPGTMSATLTLEDGTTVNLDQTQGIISENSFRVIKKDKNGQITYEAGETVDEKEISLNKITVPLGGLFEIVLPDGTHVWLNSASSLSYPSRFSSKERRVELTGEAYFEVVENLKIPFIVTAGDNEISVTGTQFNISAYEDDHVIETTLIEGGVSVSRNHSELTLGPGEQSVSITDSDRLIRKQVDTDIAMGWKNGYFIFDDQDVESIMREVARWYDVEIIFRKESGKKKVIGGMFSKSKSIEELISFLEKLNVGKFEKKERRITVMI